MPTHLHAPAAVGDVLDRISILDIKLARVGAGREHVARERAALVGAWNAAGLPSHEGVPEFPGLGAVNLALWEVEDRLRACEARGDFGPGFVADARLVYLQALQPALAPPHRAPLHPSGLGAARRGLPAQTGRLPQAPPRQRPARHGAAGGAAGVRGRGLTKSVDAPTDGREDVDREALSP